MPPKKRTALSNLISSSADEEEQPSKKAPTKPKAARKTPATSTAAGGKEKEKEKASVNKKPASKGKKPAATAATEDEIDEIEDGGEGEESELEIVPAQSKKQAAATKGMKKSTAIQKEAAKRGGKKKPIEPEPESDEGGNSEGEGEEEEDEAVVELPKRVKKAVATKRTSTEEPSPSIIEVQVPEKKKRLTKKERDALAAKEKEIDEIAETQYTPMQLDPPAKHGHEEEDELEIAPTPTQVHQANKRGGVSALSSGAAKLNGRGKTKEPIPVEEEDEAADLAVPPVRPKKGKLPPDGDHKGLEKDYQELEKRYQKLKDVRESEPEKILAKFKKNMDERLADADKLIAYLQDDNSAQSILANESKLLKRKLLAKEAEVAKLNAKINDLNRGLQEQLNENQVLAAKLSAASQPRGTVTVPGSAMKSGMGARAMIGSKPGAINAGGTDDAAWAAKVKEDLYGDLCGLWIMSVRIEAERRIYECLQTGINGTLHFKLSVPDLPLQTNSKSKNQKPPSSSNKNDDDEDNEFAFQPLFDEQRDKNVIAMLPEYLRGEISFSKDNAAMFYQRINGILSKKPEQKEESEDDSEDDDDEDDSVEGDKTMGDTTMADGH